MAKKVLDIFIDESGDFGTEKTCSELYLVALVLHDRNDSIYKEEKYLNEKLKKIGFNGMIHTMPLVTNRAEFVNYSIESKKNILWSLISFLRNSNIKIKTIIIDKKYINNIDQLKYKLQNELLNYFYNNRNYFNSFDKINIYYDNGQEPLTEIFDKVFKDFIKINKIIKFDQINNRLFQVADMLTFIEKLFYKVRNKRNLTKAEQLYFSSFDLKSILKILNNKRL